MRTGIQAELELFFCLMLLNTLKGLLGRKARQNEEKVTTDLRDQVMTLIKGRRFAEAEAFLAGVLQAPEPDPEQLALLGELRYHQQKHDEAKLYCLQALKLKPGLANAHYVLSLIHYDAGGFEEALIQAHYARNLAPANAPILAQLGLCLIAVKDYGEARNVLRQALLLDPNNVPALNNLGIAHHAMQEYDDALYYFQRALSLKPDYQSARDNLRNLFGIESFNNRFDIEANTIRTEVEISDGALGVLNEGQEAHLIETLESSFHERPDDEDTAIQLVRLYFKSLQLEAARDVLNVALARMPESVPLINLAGRMCIMLGQYNKAKTNFERVLDLDPQDVDALLGLGQALRHQDLHEEALEPIEKAVSVRETPHTLTQLAFAQVNACRYEACLQTCDCVECLRPDFAPFLISSRAVCHAYLGHFDEALRYIELAERMDINNLGFAMFRGMIHLQHENYAEGWAYYRYRSFSEGRQTRLLPFPLWQGEPLQGKTVLVLAEQGLGDQVMFASCLPDLLQLRPRQIVLEAHHRVAKTLARSFPEIRVFPSGQLGFDWLPSDLAPDYYIHIADLARHFRPSKDAFPNHKGYLRADPVRVAYWKARLDGLNDLPKIGFTWRGGLQQTRRAIRSLQLEQMQDLLGDSRAQFVNLQYGPVQEEITAFAQARGLEIVAWPEAIEDLDEFAALIQALDLVVTVCNTTVHYAGALGKPCWVMAPYIPEWRYGLKGPVMRWYPSVTMFRQHTPGDWPGVLARVHEALEGFLARSHAPLSGMNLATS
jgi:tetratricopeptide (TPR) repeat protein